MLQTIQVNIFEVSKPSFSNRFNLQVCLSVPTSVFAVLLILSVSLCDHLCFIQFGSSFYSSNFDEIRDTAPLSNLFLLSSVYFLHLPPPLNDSNVLGLRA